MFSSTLKVTACLIAVCLTVYAQNPAKKTQMAGSITGKVTVKGKRVQGIVVGVRPVQSSGRVRVATVVTTDQHGNYRFSNLAAGTYEVAPAAPQFALLGEHAVKKLLISEGEDLEGVDFALVRGGTITGKVTDAEGQPIIEEHIELVRTEETNEGPVAPLNETFHVTDDRGVYRLFGLPPGKYIVAAGTSEDRFHFGNGRRSVYSQTFHPSVTDSSKATVIEVTEGGEATNVDIVLRRSQPTFTVTARVIDADTGQPLPDVRVALQKFRENGSSASSGPSSNRLGEIKIDNVTPGKYALFVDRSLSGAGEFDGDALRFEVVDQDVRDLVIRASRAGSVSGVVILEGIDEKARNNLNSLMLYAHVSRVNRSIGWGSSSRAIVNADGSFSMGGIRSGVVQFLVHAPGLSPATEFEVSRIERDGVVQSQLEMKDREQIKGLRVIVKARTAKIRGVVKFENGQPLPPSRLQVSIKRVGDHEDKPGMGVEVDDRGRFMSHALAAGVYEVTIIAYPTHYRGAPPSAKQQVVVADNQVSEVTLTLDLKSVVVP